MPCRNYSDLLNNRSFLLVPNISHLPNEIGFTGGSITGERERERVVRGALRYYFGSSS